MDVLEIQQVSFTYENAPVLRDINLSRLAGEFYALLGPNGAGKSTLFALINRFYPLQKGHVSLMGKSLAKAKSDILSQVGVVFQQSTLDLDLSVNENLLYHCAIQGMGKKHAGERIVEQLQRFQLEDKRFTKVRQLNGGHRRRIELARALLHKPKLLLMDEPTVGLDRSSRAVLIEYVRQLCKEQQLTVLWATHLLEEVASNDNVVVLDKGEILTQRKAWQLAQQSPSAQLIDAYQQLVGGEYD